MRGSALALRSAHAGQGSCIEECPCRAVGVHLRVPTQAGVMWRRGTQAGWLLCDQRYPAGRCGVARRCPWGAIAVAACAGLGSVSDQCPCRAEWHVSVGCPCGAELCVKGCPCRAGFQVGRTPRWGKAKGQREAHAGQSVGDQRCQSAAVITPSGCPCGATEAGQEGCSCRGSEAGAS